MCQIYLAVFLHVIWHGSTLPMAITVARILQDPMFGKCRLLTTPELASVSAISWVSVIEVPVERFVRRNEFVLTTAMNVGHDLRLLTRFVRRIADCNAAALAIAIGPYVREVPQGVVAVATNRNLSLIEIRPWKLRFSEISERILQWLLDDQFRRKERDQLVWSLATGRLLPDERAAEHARRLGTSLETDFYAIAALLRPPTGIDSHEMIDEMLALAESMAANGRMQWLGANIAGRMVAFLATTRDSLAVETFLNDWLAAVRRRFPSADVVAGVSDRCCVTSGHRVRSRFVDAATAAFDVAELAGEAAGHRVARFRDVAVQVLLRRAAENPLAGRLVEDYLGPLLEHDRARKVKLLPTLEKYLSANGNVSACARSLNMRRQSLIYRLDKIKALTRCDLDDAQHRLALQLALGLRLGGGHTDFGASNQVRSGVLV